MSTAVKSKLTKVLLHGESAQTDDFLLARNSSKAEKFAFDVNGHIRRSGVTATRHCSAVVSISSANITGSSAGQLGHAAGVVLAADPGTAYVIELVSAVMSFTYATAQYTGGGNVTININGGAALTGVVSNANSLAAASSNITQFMPLSTAGFALTANKGLTLVAASAFTQPGTAAGTVKVFVQYRIHLL